MRARLTLVAMGLFALTILSFSSHAQQGAQAPRGSSSEGKDDLITNEQQLARQFAEFQDALLRLKQKLARGTPDERKRAEVLDKVLDECRNLAINQEFTKMIEILRQTKITRTDDLEKLQNQSDGIAKSLKKILDMMRDSRGDRLSEDRKRLEDIIKALDRAIEKQKQVQGQTDLGKTDSDELKKTQNDVTKKTEDVKKAIDKYLDKDGKSGESADLKGKNKDGGKGDGKQGEAKDAGKKPGEGQKAEAKGAGKDSKGQPGQAKSGAPKSGKPGEKTPDGQAKSGSKPGEKSGKEPQQASAKGKSGDPKKDAPQGSAKKGNPGDKKDQQQASAKSGGDPKESKGSAKSGEPKSGQSGKPGESGEASPSQAKAGSPDASKQGSAKSSQGAAGSQAKGGGDAKQGDAKAGNSKDGMGQAKDGGTPAQGGGAPQGQQAAQKGDGAPPSQSPPSASKQDQDVQASGKKIKEAGYDQKASEDNIGKGNNPQASKQQGDAIDKMEAAKKKLEKLLQQMREEEIERVLAALQARCEKMLMMQMQVLAGTEDTDKLIQRNSDKKPTPQDKRESLRLSDKEKEIVQECNKCIDILEAEGSAVAFPEVFQQVRQDMIHVQKRLELTDVAEQTQGIERDIIDTLKEMIEALKKARQENSDPKKSNPGKSGKPGDQKLLELIQELKMVRSLQKRVNDRTTDYGKRYQGEQANDAAVVRNLRQLAERQQRIQEIVSRISKGDNK